MLSVKSANFGKCICTYVYIYMYAHIRTYAFIWFMYLNGMTEWNRAFSSTTSCLKICNSQGWPRLKSRVRNSESPCGWQGSKFLDYHVPPPVCISRKLNRNRNTWYWSWHSNMSSKWCLNISLLTVPAPQVSSVLRASCIYRPVISLP